MSRREFTRRPTTAEMETANAGKIVDPITLRIKYPELFDGDVKVIVKLYAHDGGHTNPTERTFLFQRDKISSILYSIGALEPSLRVREISKLARAVDRAKEELSIEQARIYDESSGKDRTGKCGDVINAMFHNDKVCYVMRRYIFLDTVLTLAEKQSFFHSEEMKSLFA